MAEQKKKRATARDMAAAFYEGYSYDTFTCELLTPTGKRTTIDDAACELCRMNPDISLPVAMDTAKVWVRNNPARQFDGLKKRIESLSSAYTDHDAGAIDRYAERCGLDAYEARRIRLWLYQVMGRGILRGEKTDNMLVISGLAEGTGKSSFFDGISRVLCGKGAAPVTTLDKDKDLSILLATTPIVYIDEIDKVLSKADVALLKARITETGDTVRAPYDRDARRRDYCAVWGATTNETKPLPEGEREGRRYWVIRPPEGRKLSFTGSCEIEAMLREAARLTLHEMLIAGILAQNGGELVVTDLYDPQTTVGKNWIETDEEAAETRARNASLKSEGAPTLAIVAALSAIRRMAPASWERPFRTRDVCAAIETGDGRAMGLDGVSWSAPRAQGREIARLLRARLATKCHRWNGEYVRGVTPHKIAEEFASELTSGEAVGEVPETVPEATNDPFHFV